jgi:hypothetical protein
MVLEQGMKLKQNGCDIYMYTQVSGMQFKIIGIQVGGGFREIGNRWGDTAWDTGTTLEEINEYYEKDGLGSFEVTTDTVVL